MTHTVLLIEDNEQNRYLTRFLLERNGYQVIVAEDGPQGLHLARTILPDIILLDIQLPMMDGYAVARALREIDDLRATNLIAVTSYAMVGDREKCMAAGCNGYIEKPINPDTFITDLEHIMSLGSINGGKV